VGRLLAAKLQVEIRLEETNQLMPCTRQTEQPNGGGGERNRRVCRRQIWRVEARGEFSGDEISQVLYIEVGRSGQ
jgi:hypothetical protein